MTEKLEHILYNRDYCEGCASGKKQKLPEDWKEGDPIPEDVAVHFTENKPRKFVFKSNYVERVYLEPVDPKIEWPISQEGGPNDADKT